MQIKTGLYNKANPVPAAFTVLVLMYAVLSGIVLADASIVDNILNQEVDMDYGEYLASECASCHNPQADAGSAVPNIHGLDAQYIVESLIAFRSGERVNSTMQDVASALGDEEIAALAAFLSASQ